MRDNKSTSSVEAIERAIRILDSFSFDHPELGVAEISRALQLKRSTVHRALATLEAGGLLRQDPLSQKYALGSKLLKFAHVLQAQMTLNAISLPHMKNLRDQFNETVALHVLEGSSRVVVLQVESTQDLRRIYHEIGKPQPLHAGSPGKVILAFMPPDQVRQVIQEEGLRRFASNTVVDEGELLLQLAQIRRQGYAVSSGERTDGIASISSPIGDQSGRVIASINISGPEMRFTDERALECLPSLREATRAISRELGWTGWAPNPRPAESQ